MKYLMLMLMLAAGFLGVSRASPPVILPNFGDLTFVPSDTESEILVDQDAVSFTVLNLDGVIIEDFSTGYHDTGNRNYRSYVLILRQDPCLGSRQRIERLE